MLPQTTEDMRSGTLRIAPSVGTNALECADCGNVIRVRLYDNGEMQFQCVQCRSHPFKVVGVVSPDVVEGIPTTVATKEPARWDWCGAHDWMDRLMDRER